MEGNSPSTPRSRSPFLSFRTSSRSPASAVGGGGRPSTPSMAATTLQPPPRPSPVSTSPGRSISPVGGAAAAGGGAGGATVVTPRASPGRGESTGFLALSATARKKGPNDKKEEAQTGKDPQAALEESFLVMTDASIEATPDPVAEISSILGNTKFDTPVLRLDIQALLVQEMDSIVIVEINISTTNEEKWVEVARSTACYNSVEPRYYGNPHQEVPFGVRDQEIKLTLMNVTDPQSYSFIGSAVLSTATLALQGPDKVVQAPVMVGDVKRAELLVRAEVDKQVLDEPLINEKARLGYRGSSSANNSHHSASSSSHFSSSSASTGGGHATSTSMNKKAVDKRSLFTHFHQPSWVPVTQACILTYEDFFTQYKDRLDYREQMAETTFTLAIEAGPCNPLDKPLYLTISRHPRDAPVQLRTFRNMEAEGDWFFRGEIVAKGQDVAQWKFSMAIRQLTAQQEDDKYHALATLWAMDGPVAANAHSYVKLPFEDLMTSGDRKHPIYPCPRFRDDKRTMGEDAKSSTYLSFIAHSVVADQGGGLHELKLSGQTAKDFYKIYLVTMLRASREALQSCRQLEQARREQEATLLKFVYSARQRIACTIVFDRSRRNGPETEDLTQRRLMYLHEGGSSNKANLYAQIMARFSAALIKYHPRQVMPVYFFGGVDADLLKKSPDTSEAKAPPIYPLEIARHPDLYSAAEVLVAYDSCLRAKNYRSRETPTPLSTVLQATLEKQPILDPETGHSVLLFLTASDLLPPAPASNSTSRGNNNNARPLLPPPSDAELFSGILRSLRGRNITIIIVRLHGPHLRRFERLTNELIDQACGNEGPRQFHVIDIRTFPRLARRIEYHQRMAAEIAANPARASVLLNKSPGRLDDPGDLMGASSSLLLTQWASSTSSFADSPSTPEYSPMSPGTATANPPSTRFRLDIKSTRLSLNLAKRMSAFLPTGQQQPQEQDKEDGADAGERVPKHKTFDIRKRDVIHVIADKWKELPRHKARALLMPVQGVHEDSVLTYPEVSQVRQILFNETIDQHMDLIFGKLLADLCDSEASWGSGGGSHHLSLEHHHQQLACTTGGFLLVQQAYNSLVATLTFNQQTPPATTIPKEDPQKQEQAGLGKPSNGSSDNNKTVTVQQQQQEGSATHKPKRPARLQNVKSHNNTPPTTNYRADGE